MKHKNDDERRFAWLTYASLIPLVPNSHGWLYGSIYRSLVVHGRFVFLFFFFFFFPKARIAMPQELKCLVCHRVEVM